MTGSVGRDKDVEKLSYTTILPEHKLDCYSHTDTLKKPSLEAGESSSVRLPH